MDRFWTFSQERPCPRRQHVIPLETPYLCMRLVEFGPSQTGDPVLKPHFQNGHRSYRIFHGCPHCPQIYRILGHQSQTRPQRQASILT